MANASTISGVPITTAVSTDPDLCRISGFLKNAHGQPLKGWSFVLRYRYTPLGLLSDTLILQERLTIKADAAGYVEFDLLRNSEVELELPNLLPWVHKCLVVPDAASADLLDFLFPYLISVDWCDPGPIVIVVGGGVTAKLEGTLSNGQVVDVSAGAATLVSSDPSILTLASPPSFRALAVGSVTISVTEVDRSKIDLNEDRQGDPLTFFSLPAVTLPAPISVTVNP